MTIPTVLKGIDVDIIAHVVPGQVPFLLSQTWMSELGAVVDTLNSTVEFKAINVVIRVDETEAGFMGLDLISGAAPPGFHEGRARYLRPRR